MLFCFKKEMKQIETVRQLFCLFLAQIMLFCNTGNHTETRSQFVCNLSVRLAVRLLQFTDDVAFQFSLLVAAAWQVSTLLAVVEVNRLSVCPFVTVTRL